MSLEWNLHYFRYVIEDGEPERHVGDVFDWFAVAVWSDSALSRVSEERRIAVPVADHAYRVNAGIVHISHDPVQAACILDFGIRVISGNLAILPPQCQQGQYVAGEVRLELPLCTPVFSHNLAHQWRVNRISADLTPYVPDPISGWFRHDPSQAQYQDVPGTDSVHAECYVLHCSNLNP